MGINIEQAIDEIKLLSIGDRLMIVEAVWDSLSDDAQSIPLSPEQEAELDRRLNAHEANPGNLLTWDQVLERMQGKL